VLEARQGHRVVLHAEVEDVGLLAPEVGDQRVVGVQHELRAAGAPRDDGGPAIGDRLELAEAVELVAEEVAEQQRARIELGDDALEPELVDLEEAELAMDAPARPRRVEQGRGHATGHVRTRAVVDEARARAGQDRGGHRGGGGLPVRGRDHRAAGGEPAGQRPDRRRVQAHEHLPGQARSAAAAGAARQGTDRPGGEQLGGQRVHAGASTRTAPARALIVAGSSAIGSPSA